VKENQKILNKDIEEYVQEEWTKLACIGAIHTQFSSKKGESDERHYYIELKIKTFNKT
jgi:hypothetical protein